MAVLIEVSLTLLRQLRVPTRGRVVGRRSLPVLGVSSYKGFASPHALARLALANAVGGGIASYWSDERLSRLRQLRAAARDGAVG